MPIAPTYPGVYIQEVPSGVRTIIGVSTSVAAFVGYFSRGPMNEAVQIFGLADFNRRFGGLRADSEAAYAIQQFFLNGGTQAWLVRTASSTSPPRAATVDVSSGAGALAACLRLEAASPGAWGDNLRVDIDYGTVTPADSFNLTVTELQLSGGRMEPVNTETFRNLTTIEGEVNFIVDVLEHRSRLIRAELLVDLRPAQTGTVSQLLDETTWPGLGLDPTETMEVQLHANSPFGPATTAALGALPASVTPRWLASRVQTLFREIDAALSSVTVEVIGEIATGAYLRINVALDEPGAYITCNGALAIRLGFDDASRANVQQYASVTSGLVQAQLAASTGEDGGLPESPDLVGDPDTKTGMHALEDTDIFNILCIPDTSRLDDAAANAVAEAAERFCLEQRAFYILDVPQVDSQRDRVEEMRDWLGDNSTLRHTNAAVYFPRPHIADPLNGFRPRSVAPSGIIAGLYARTDSDRGVWKAPAGIDATLRGVHELGYVLTDRENGVLNPLGINCLRNFEVHGNVCWGARTLEGADARTSEWKYVPVRRLALFLEESLYRGTQWVVFEPNDEPLWSQIRLNVGAFMHRLFRQGAFQGTTPREAYLVKCDHETTIQDDINQGIVNIVVGFAPLKPAEFVIIKIQQMAGQIET